MIAECAALLGIQLFTCLSGQPQCLPPPLILEFPLLRQDLAALAEQESGFNAWAIRDEMTGESLFPLSRAAADREVTWRDDAGHVLGVGMFQITGRANWRRHGLSRQDLTDPCQNMAAGAAHYADNLRSAARQLYNSGRTTGAPLYAAQVADRRARLAHLLDARPAPSPPPKSPVAPTQRATAFAREEGRATAFSRVRSRPDYREDNPQQRPPEPR